MASAPWWRNRSCYWATWIRELFSKSRKPLRDNPAEPSAKLGCGPLLLASFQRGSRERSEVESFEDLCHAVVDRHAGDVVDFHLMDPGCDLGGDDGPVALALMLGVDGDLVEARRGSFAEEVVRQRVCNQLFYRAPVARSSTRNVGGMSAGCRRIRMRRCVFGACRAATSGSELQRGGLRSRTCWHRT